jgi:hypothetical protein
MMDAGRHLGPSRPFLFAFPADALAGNALGFKAFADINQLFAK